MPKISAMPKSFFAFLLFCTTVMTATSTLSQTASDNDDVENLVGTAVVLRTLDKVTATTKDYTVKIGETLEYGNLSIKAEHCEKKPPTEIPETYAFLQIKETLLNGHGEIADASSDVEDGQKTIFSGWMFASDPAISALDHRVYDVWVIDCKVPVGETGLRR